MRHAILLLAGGAIALLSQRVNAETLFAITANGFLNSFDSATPGTATSSLAISGLAMGESLVGIDFRPANSTLYGVSNASKLYTLNTFNGKATQVGMGSFNVPLMGSSFGVDFNPMADLLRVVSDTGQNLRIGPNDGIVRTNISPTGDGTLNYGGKTASGVVAAAYTNNVPMAASTVLYDIDAILDQLVTQAPPNTGNLNVVGPLGFNPTPLTGFDISYTGIAYVSSGNNLWTLDLSLKTAPQLLGAILPTQGFEITDITAAPAPEPATWALLGLGLTGLAIRKYRA